MMDLKANNQVSKLNQFLLHLNCICVVGFEWGNITPKGVYSLLEIKSHLLYNSVNL